MDHKASASPSTLNAPITETVNSVGAAALEEVEVEDEDEDEDADCESAPVADVL